MKTWVKVLVPLILIVFVLAPGITGYFVESVIDRSKEDASVMLRAEGFSLLDSSFERGWFGSDQTAEFRIDNPLFITVLQALAEPGTDSELPLIVIETRATHGVLPLVNPAQGGLKPAVAQTHSRLFLKYPSGQKMELPVGVFTSLGMGGGWTRLVAQPVTRKVRQGRTTTDFQWEGADIEGTGNFQNTGSIQGKIGSLKIVSPEGKINLSAVNLSGQFETGPYSFPVLRINLDVPAASIAAQNSNLFRLQNLRLDSSLDTHSNRAIGAHSMQTSEVAFAGVDFAATDLVINFDLDAAAFSDFFDSVQRLNSQGNQTANSDALDSALMEVVRKGGSMELEKLDLDLDGNLIHLDLRLDIPRGHADVGSALQNSSGKGTVTLPQAAVDLLADHFEQLAYMIQIGAGAGFIQKKDGVYTADMVLEDGLLLLNGLPMQLPF